MHAWSLNLLSCIVHVYKTTMMEKKKSHVCKSGRIHLSRQVAGGNGEKSFLGMSCSFTKRKEPRGHKHTCSYVCTCERYSIFSCKKTAVSKQFQYFDHILLGYPDKCLISTEVNYFILFMGKSDTL